ncbi:MAG: hypothetical protein L0H64_10100, partial [Pseudonocardia sp.]|nr:hypothetical protein [Pseudonocardia sp.]
MSGSGLPETTSDGPRRAGRAQGAPRRAPGREHAAARPVNGRATATADVGASFPSEPGPAAPA